MGASPAAALGSLHPNGLPTHWSEYFVPGTSVDHQRAVFDSISSMISSERLAQLTQDRTDIRMIVNECLSTRIARANRNSVLPRLDFRGLRLDHWTPPTASQATLSAEGAPVRVAREPLKRMLHTIDFSGASLVGARLSHHDFNACTFHHVDLTRTELTGSSFSMATIDSKTIFCLDPSLHAHMMTALRVPLAQDVTLSVAMSHSRWMEMMIQIDRLIRGVPLKNESRDQLLIPLWTGRPPHRRNGYVDEPLQSLLTDLSTCRQHYPYIATVHRLGSLNHGFYQALHAGNGLCLPPVFQVLFETLMPPPT